MPLTRRPRRRLLTAGLLVLAAATSSGATLTLDAPGTLAAALATLPDATTELTLRGRAYAAELLLLREELPALVGLDLRDLALTPPEVPPYAFAATSLTAVALPDDVAVVGEAAFAAIAAPAVPLPAGLDSIGPYAFAHSALVAVDLPAALRTVGDCAFGDCAALATLTGGSGVVTIGAGAFHGIAATSLDMSGWRSLRTVGDRAFEGCTALAAVALPQEGGYSLGEGVFMGCTALAALHGGPVDDVPALALAGAPSAPLGELVGDGTRTIGPYALSGNRSVAVALPASLDSIGSHAMERMAALEAIDATALPAVPALGSEVWHSVDQAAVALTVADDLADTFAAADQWREFSISRQSSSVADTPADGLAAGIALRFEGTTLVVAASEAIAAVAAVTLDGIALARQAPAATEARLDAARWPGRIVIVTVALAGGHHETFTLMR